jgi:hypothetical protein
MAHTVPYTILHAMVAAVVLAANMLFSKEMGAGGTVLFLRQ